MSSTMRNATGNLRICWKCGQQTPKGHFCEVCGADLWNPPQGRQPLGATPPPAFFGQKSARQEGASTMSTPKPSNTATAGIIIIATLMALTFWFWFGFGVAAGVNPPEREYLGSGVYVEGDYFSAGRIWFAIIASMVLTAGTWAIAKSFEA